jgi:hypothetical protein
MGSYRNREETTSMATTFACDMTAIPASERGLHHQLIRRLVDQAVEEIIELPNGFELRFPSSEFSPMAEFVGRERLCCPFIAFRLEVPPERGSLSLRMTGADGARDFIRAELGLPSVGPRRDPR